MNQRFQELTAATNLSGLAAVFVLAVGFAGGTTGCIFGVSTSSDDFELDTGEDAGPGADGGGEVGDAGPADARGGTGDAGDVVPVDTESDARGSDAGRCPGGRAASAETCNGKDDDCDGKTDENLVQSCGRNQGTCEPGKQRCTGGTWSKCRGNVGRGEEKCNRKDDDCDGRTDEGMDCSCSSGSSRPCGGSTGVCKKGTQRCKKGSWGPCQNNRSPSGETCDGKDNDCDGDTDEGLTRSCGKSTGRCQTGTETCSGGSWGSCRNNVTPSSETCDGKDNDCDGDTDEKLTRSCGKSTGVCQKGTESCAAGSWGACTGGMQSSPEACNGMDDDCDGTTDEWSDLKCLSLQMFGTSELDHPADIAVDGSGNVYIGGFTGAGLGGRSYNGGFDDGFVAKFDASGSLKWVRLIGDNKEDAVKAVAVDKSGDVYVGGRTESGLGGHTHQGGKYDAFLAKYSASGTRQWLHQFGTKGGNNFTGLATDGSGHVYASGWTGAATGGQSYHGGALDAVVAKYDSSGSRKWIRLFGSSDIDSTDGITVDASGAVYVVGDASVAWGGQSFNGGAYDAFLVKYSPSGTQQWVRLFGSSDWDNAFSVASDGSGSIYVGGRAGAGFAGEPFQGGFADAMLAKFNTSGVRKWVRLYGTSENDSVIALDVAPNGDVRVGGTAKVPFGGQSYHGGSNDGYLATFNGAGTRQRVQLIGSSADDQIFGLDASANGVFITGSTSGSVGGGSNSGSSDGFVGPAD